jgi:hypothetical protein
MRCHQRDRELRGSATIRRFRHHRAFPELFPRWDVLLPTRVDLPRLTRAVVAAAAALLSAWALGLGVAGTTSVIGAFAIVYGESGRAASHVRVVLGYGLVLMVAAASGAGLGALTATTTRGTADAIFVAAMVAIAAITAGLVKAYRTRPPGSFLIVLSFELSAAVTMQGVHPVALMAAGAVGAAAALGSAVLVGPVGLRSGRDHDDPLRSRWSNPSRVAAANAVADADADGAARGHRRDVAAALAVRLAVAGGLAGTAALACGLPRPDWAVMSAVMVLHQGPGRTVGSIRGLHRLVGTVLGCGVFVVLSAAAPHPAVVAVAVAVMFTLGDLFLARHYGIAMAFITPMAMAIGNEHLSANASHAAGTRVAETVIGVVAALAVLNAGVLRRPR